MARLKGSRITLCEGGRKGWFRYNWRIFRTMMQLWIVAVDRRLTGGEVDQARRPVRSRGSRWMSGGEATPRSGGGGRCSAHRRGDVTKGAWAYSHRGSGGVRTGCPTTADSHMSLSTRCWFRRVRRKTVRVRQTLGVRVWVAVCVSVSAPPQLLCRDCTVTGKWQWNCQNHSCVSVRGLDSTDTEKNWQASIRRRGSPASERG